MRNKNELLKVAIRQQAIYLSVEDNENQRSTLTKDTILFVANLRRLGYAASAELLLALNRLTQTEQEEIFHIMKDVTGSNLNWAPLVKGWDIPTGEKHIDHLITFFANIVKSKKGITLPCGHLIPDNTFPLERYNGCPFCGTPFVLKGIELDGQSSKLKVLELWRKEELSNYLSNLLQSRTALDATQADSLKTLLVECKLPEVEIPMKETQLLVIDTLIENGEENKAGRWMNTPTDILRYLWYKQTGYMQIIAPKIILRAVEKNNMHILSFLSTSQQAKRKTKQDLKLKYSRRKCRMVACWLNNLNMEVEEACENMHPKRNMWIRFIRALRLAEYARKPGFDYLRKLMDCFYNQNYPVYQGEIECARLKSDAVKAFPLLKQRPGLFARSLFANMLWFGDDETLNAFREVLYKVPTRLILTLNMYAANYFNPEFKRMVKPLGGTPRLIPPNQLVRFFTQDQLQAMVQKVEALCVEAVGIRFAGMPTKNSTIYIEPALYNIPLPIGDRSETVHDLSAALMGMRFPLEGNKVRLFMQWGEGLPAQHLDMDLSCHITFNEHVQVCSYYQLTAIGACHSGDIRSIPDKVGTAEYIELDLDQLTGAHADYVVFTCNAYSNGAITPNLKVGWMNSAYPMKISEQTGVAFDPSCVQHMVRVTNKLTKGLAFGVLDVTAREIIWLEMPFDGQTVAHLNQKTVEALLQKLNSKTTIGNLLEIKAKAQYLEIVETPEKADEIYTLKWATNVAAVTQLLIG